jgi:hypothetical protein
VNRVRLDHQQGDVLVENVRWLLDQGMHREWVVERTGRRSLPGLIRELQRMGEHELARRLYADPAPEAVNARALAPMTKAEIRQVHR